jgi:hypothetical protein
MSTFYGLLLARRAKHNPEKFRTQEVKRPMDVVELPLLPMGTPLRSAITIMRSQNRSAVAAQEAGIYWLFTAGQIYAGSAHHAQALSDLDKKVSVPAIPKSDIEAAGADLRNPHLTWRQFEELLDQKATQYAIIASVADSVTIVTRHETLAAKVSVGPKDCYCSGPNEHEFPPPPARAGDLCPLCSYPVYCSP